MWLRGKKDGKEYAVNGTQKACNSSGKKKKKKDKYIILTVGVGFGALDPFYSNSF